MLQQRPLFIGPFYTKQQPLTLQSLELTLFSFAALTWRLLHSKHSRHLSTELTPGLSLTGSHPAHLLIGIQVRAPLYPSCHLLNQTLSIFHFLLSSHPLPATVHTAARGTILSHETGGFPALLPVLQPALAGYPLVKVFTSLPRPLLIGLSSLVTHASQDAAAPY